MGTIYINQDQYDSGYNFAPTSSGNYYLYQSFTPGSSGYITSITLLLKVASGSAVGNMSLKVYLANTLTEDETGPVLETSSTYNTAGLTTSYQAVTFTFAGTTLLTRNTMYVIKSTNAHTSGTVVAAFTSQNVYGLGKLQYTLSAGSYEPYFNTTTGTYNGADFYFKIGLTENDDTAIIKQIKAHHSRVFRKAYIKRRSSIDGTFETSWQEITKDVKKWGSINVNTDVDRVGRVSFSGTNLVMQNIEGRYNPNSNSFSLWYGYASQQRTLIKIECGFYKQYKSGGIWVNEIIPSDPTIFIGIISGSIRVSDENEITLPIKPVNQVFRDFLASELTGYTSGIGPGASGTAANFMTMLRDQADGSSNYIFRPFFGDTTTYWQITQTSSNTYPSIDTSTASDLRDLSVWDVIEKMAEAEQYIPYITRTGVFKWIPKTAASTTSYEFHGLGIIPDTDYGHTIKNVDSYGEKISEYYNRISIKFDDTMTSSGFAATSVAFAFNGTNAVWNIGRRTYSVENFWMNTTTANAVASSLLTELSSLNEEINFSTSLIPHLSLLDRVTISYDSTDFSTVNSYWDVTDWDTYFTWDAGRGDAIVLTDSPFKILSININLDNLESRFVARKLSS